LAGGPDPAELWLAERLAIAERVKKGKLCEGNGDRQMKELSARIRKRIEQG